MIRPDFCSLFSWFLYFKYPGCQQPIQACDIYMARLVVCMCLRTQSLTLPFHFETEFPQSFAIVIPTDVTVLSLCVSFLQSLDKSQCLDAVRAEMCLTINFERFQHFKHWTHNYNIYSHTHNNNNFTIRYLLCIPNTNFRFSDSIHFDDVIL